MVSSSKDWSISSLSLAVMKLLANPFWRELEVEFLMYINWPSSVRAKVLNFDIVLSSLVHPIFITGMLVS